MFEGKLSRLGNFFYEALCWSAVLVLLWLFWYGFGRDSAAALDDRGTDTYRGVDL